MKEFRSWIGVRRVTIRSHTAKARMNCHKAPLGIKDPAAGVATNE